MDLMNGLDMAKNCCVETVIMINAQTQSSHLGNYIPRTHVCYTLPSWNYGVSDRFTNGIMCAQYLGNPQSNGANLLIM